MTQNRKKERLYITTFALICILLLGVIGIVNYWVDPFFQFRVKDNRYMLNPQFVNAGLIKNYDYNTVIIGSSMVQNYDLSILRKDSTVKPLKLSLGGLNLREIIYLHSLIGKKEVDTYIVNIDLSLFNVEQRLSENHFPHYLSNNDLLSKMRYLWGYESSVRYTPLDIALGMYLDRSPKNEVPADIRYRTNIDHVGYFAHLSNYNNVPRIKADYLNGNSVSSMKLKGMDKRMSDNLYSLFNSFDIKNSQSEYIFVMPPYSVLYWYHTYTHGYYSNFKDFIRMFVREAEKYPNVKVMCFYDIDEITDLRNYSDLTHYSPLLSDKIVNNLFSEKYLVTSENVNEVLTNLDNMVYIFARDNKDWLAASNKNK